jgi:hypothetical protein
MTGGGADPITIAISLAATLRGRPGLPAVDSGAHPRKLMPRHIHGPRLMALICLTLVVFLGAAPTAGAATRDFPSGSRGYHTYDEMRIEVSRIARAHPSIVRQFTMGWSYQGRRLVAVEVTSSKLPESGKPGVLFDGLHHALEHMSLEMTLGILHWLVDGYGSNATITRLVDTRSIFIVFMVNPDGGEYDISGGRFHFWRKNRQPNSGTTAIGTDLNRNYDYRWGCCGLVSRSPSSGYYRGRAPFSAPETRAIRDFVASRVINGRQQIRTAISFHTSGRLILWPYGYTKTAIPSDMRPDDHAVFVAMGKVMAGRNGYKPEQASALYTSSGSLHDWAYGRWRIFSFTFELGATAWTYPPDTRIGPEIARNKGAVMYLIDRAACPYVAIGKQAQYCSS